MTPLRPGLRSTLASATEEAVENVSDAKSLVTASVVACSSAAVTENLVSVRDKLEALLSFLSRIDIGVKLSCQFAISLLDLILGRISRDSENFIVIAQEFASSTLLRYFATALTDAMFPE